MSSLRFSTFLILIFFFNAQMESMTYAARILGVFPVTSSSHQIVYRAVMKELALRGHELVVITPYPMRDPSIKNYTEIDVSFMNKAWQNRFNFAEGRSGKETSHEMMANHQDFGGLLCELMLSHPQVKELISSQENDQHFDLIFLEMLTTPGIIGFIHRFPVPSIGIASLPAFGINYDSVGNPNLPAYAPDVFLPYSDRMTFFERMHSMFFLLWLKYYFYYTVIPTQDAIARRHFGESMPYLADLHFKPSMLFVTTDFIFHSPRPNVPAVVQLSGLHINSPKPLPKLRLFTRGENNVRGPGCLLTRLHTQRPRNGALLDLKDFMDSALEGVIYFGLGSNVRSDTMDAQKRQIFLEVFSELPGYHVLWKWESDSLPGQPKNVKLAKWLPQQDVLRHPKVKVFITQGGLQSLEEAITMGVPLIGIPFFTDQDFNVKRIVERGIGLKIEFTDVTKESVLKSLKNIIYDNWFRENIKRISVLREDMPDKPLEHAVWWTEYVLRHKGAPHLRTAAVDMPCLLTMFYLKSSIFLILIAFFKSQMESMTHAARILGVFPVTSTSHQIVFRAVMKELAHRGHEMVVITPYPMRDPSVKNYTEIDVSFMNKEWKNRFNFVAGRSSKESPQEMMTNLFNFGGHLCELMLSHPEVAELISTNKTDENFDLVFLQWFMTPGIYGFVHRFKVPFIGIASFPGFGIGHDSVGNPNLPAYVPEVFLPYSGEMTILERAHSMIYLLWLKYHFYYTVLPKQDAIARKHFGEAMPYLGDLHFQPSMMFVTTDFIFHNPRPNVPAVVQLSGLHINSPKPLPKDIKEFMDSAPEGVIYFSLGSNVRSDTMDAQKRHIFLDAFSELPRYHVLWKWESDRLPGQPKNVKIAKWMPQQDVLRHPRVKVFITQGGLQSGEEAMAMGVPLIGIPFFADQDFNVNKIVEKRIGLKIDFSEVTKEIVLESLNKIIHDHSFQENIKRLSVLRNDMPDKPLERAVWWTEYVLRHKGAMHLRTAAVNMPWYQLLLLDVILLLTFGTCSLVDGVHTKTHRCPAPHLCTAAVDMPWYQFLLLDVIALLLLIARTALLVLYLFIRKVHHSIRSFIGKKRKFE
uniref:UDP-glycosyltransferases domain-containing protein n=1 Tax=Timema douglasi TaxID=61478 RepID=A0A7R8VE06_TIMDO|nr:unnamed protein product [Timema douglasi]